MLMSTPDATVIPSPVHRVLGVVERVRVLSFGVALSMGCA